MAVQQNNQPNQMNIVLVKPDLKVSISKEVSAGDNPVKLGSSEILLNASVLAQIPEVDGIYIFTNLAKDVMLQQLTEKIHLVSFDSENLFEKLNNNSKNVFICWCGYNNFFGGAPLPYMIRSYYLMSKWKNKKCYVVTDNRGGMWPIDIDKQFSSHYDEPLWQKHLQWLPHTNFNDWVRDTDLLVQSRNVEAIKDIIKNKKVKDFKSIRHISLEFLPLLSKQQKFNENPSIDCFFSSQNFVTLTPYRKNQLAQYLDKCHDITLVGTNPQAMFDQPRQGNLKIKLVNDGSYPQPIEGINYFDFPKFLYTAASQVVLSEKEYEKCGLMPNRLAEGVASKVVNFIHKTVDPNKEFFAKSPELQDFLYLETEDELNEKIALIKNDKAFFKHICQEQCKAVGKDEYEQLKQDWKSYLLA